MKSNRYKTTILLGGLLVIAGLFLSSCEIEEIPNPNSPDLVDIENNATEGDIRIVATGIEHLLRDEMGFYYDVLGILGREYYFFTNSDPRYTGELLGKGAATLDNAGFYGTRPYAGRYRVIKNANILITAVNNSSADLTDEEKNGLLGYAKTVQGYSLLLALNMQYQNGVRVDVVDPDNLGEFLSYDASLTAISALLDEGSTNLAAGGDAFAFPLSSGFEGFDDPDGFNSFNRAIAARIAIYQENKSAALAALGNSFFDIAGDLETGPQYFYSVAGGDLTNPVFRTPDQSEALVAHPSFETDILAGDTRINKITARTATAVLDDLSGDFDVTIYQSLAATIPIIRNEELVLLYAEANIGTNNAEAIVAIDVIRTAHGLPAYSGGTSDSELMDELSYNRRFSLFGEAHRWIDMRRWDRLDELPKDRLDDDVWDQLPRPVSENQ